MKIVKNHFQEYWARQPKTKNILPAATIMMQPGQMVQPGQPAGQFLLQPVGTAGTGIVQQQILSPVHGQTVQSGQIIHQASQFQGQVQVQGQAQVQGQPKIIQQVQQPIGPQSQVLFLQSPTQPGRIIQQQPLNIQMGHQGPIQYILSPGHAVSSPMTSPVPLNQTYPSQITITHSPHTPSVIKQNNFGVIKTSPGKSHVKMSRTFNYVNMKKSNILSSIITIGPTSANTETNIRIIEFGKNRTT